MVAFLLPGGASAYRAYGFVGRISEAPSGNTLLLLRRLDRCQRDGVNDIVYQCATRQVVHRFAHALQHWPDGDQVGRTLYRFVGGVTGVQVWEDEHGSATRNRRVRCFGFCNIGHNSRIVLQRTVDHQVRTFFLCQTSRFAHFLYIATCTRSTGRVGEHCHAWFDTESNRRVSRLDSDFCQLFCSWIWVDRAVTVNINLFWQQHEEHRRDQRAARCSFDKLQRWTDGVRGGVNRTGNQSVNIVLFQHKSAKNYIVFKLFARDGFGHPFVFTQFDQTSNIAFANHFWINDFNAYRRKLAERTTQAQVGEAERSASGKVQAQVEDATAATTPTDKLTLSKGAAASKVEDKLMAEKQSTAQNDRTKELERNLAELEKLSDASAATTAAGSVAASAETAMPPTPGDNATAGDAPASPLTVEANAPVLPTDAGQPAPADPAPASTAAAAPDTPAEPAPPARKAAQKAPQPAPVPEPSLVDQLLENPLLPAGGVAVLGLLGLLAWRKRKQQAAAASAFNDSSLEVAPAPDSLFDSSGGQQIDTNSDTPASTMAYSPSQLDANGDVDPIAEADVYLAYGKEDEAIKILAEALRSAPDRLNIHIKLAEIYAKQQDLTQLEVTARAVKGLTQGQGSDWERVRTLGFNMDPYNSLYAEGTTTGAAAAAAATTTGFAQALAQSAETAAPTPSLESELLIPPSIQDDDSTDQFIASIDSSLNIEAPPSQPELPSQIQDTQFVDSMLSPQEAVPSFDFSRVDLDLPSGTDSATTPATEANAAPAPAPAETLDFSLDSSFGFPTPAPAAETPAEEDDFGLSRLDFTDTPATFDTPAPPAAPATTPPDDDFGLGALDLPTAEAATAPPAVTDALPDFAADFGLDGLDLDLPSSPSTEAETTDSNDPLNTKLDLAQEFSMIGDSEGARTLIEEVLSEAQGTLKTRAQKMLNELE